MASTSVFDPNDEDTTGDSPTSRNGKTETCLVVGVGRSARTPIRKGIAVKKNYQTLTSYIADAQLGTAA
jgi:hypothetical protein